MKRKEKSKMIKSKVQLFDSFFEIKIEKADKVKSKREREGKRERE